LEVEKQYMNRIIPLTLFILGTTGLADNSSSGTFRLDADAPYFLFVRDTDESVGLSILLSTVI
jgi:hypothetical protein